jgi:hypothetical protein
MGGGVNIITVTTPLPACILPIDHPARANTGWEHVDVSATFAMHAPFHAGDDYDRVQADDWLSAAGGFK